jgi:hypothetical protein
MYIQTHTHTYRLIDMVVNCFHTFRFSYMVQANCWKCVYNLTFHLLTKLLLEIQLYNFFATVDKNISFCLSCGFLHPFPLAVCYFREDNMSPGS